MKRTVVIVFVLTVMLTAAAAWAQAPRFQARRGAGGMGRPMMTCPAMAVMTPSPFMIDRLADELELTEKQKEELMQVITKANDEMSPLLKKGADSSRALRKALFASKFDEQEVKKLAAAAERAEAAIIKARIREWKQIRAILNKEQIAALSERMSMRGPGMGGRQRGPGGPDGMGMPGGPLPPPPPGQ